MVKLSASTGGLVGVEIVRSGSFEFKEVRSGSYKLTVESMGFEMGEKTVDLYRAGPVQSEFVQITLGKRLPEKASHLPRRGEKTVAADWLAIPKKARKEMDKAIQASRRNDHKKAIAHLRKAIKIHPGFAEAYNNLGAQYSKLGKGKDAVEALGKSIQLKPAAQTYLNLGFVYLQQGLYAESLKPLQESHRLDPENPIALESLGEAYFGIGQYLLALNCFQQSAGHKARPDLHFAMGHCYLRLNLQEDALRQFESFLQLSPNSKNASQVRRLVSRIQAARP